MRLEMSQAHPRRQDSPSVWELMRVWDQALPLQMLAQSNNFLGYSQLGHSMSDLARFRVPCNFHMEAESGNFQSALRLLLLALAVLYRKSRLTR
jgi:hypothetical protein